MVVRARVRVRVRVGVIFCNDCNLLQLGSWVNFMVTTMLVAHRAWHQAWIGACPIPPPMYTAQARPGAMHAPYPPPCTWPSQALTLIQSG